MLKAGWASTPADQTSVVNFELALFTAQVTDANAGDLTANMGAGGPTYLSTQAFWTGINDPLGQNPTHLPFTASSMTVFAKWSGSSSAPQAAIARGEVVFNTKPIAIAGVRGLNDTLVKVSVLNGTCTTCLRRSQCRHDHSR